MDKDNSHLLHSLIFAVAVIFCVYAADHVKTHPNAENVILMKCSAISSGGSVIAIVLSFLPSVHCMMVAKKRNELLDKIRLFYEGCGKNVKITDVAKVQKRWQEAGYLGARQDYLHFMNNILVTISGAFLIGAIILFTIGVCLL